MAKRKINSDFVKNPDDFKIKIAGKSHNVRDIIQEMQSSVDAGDAKMSYEYSKSNDQDQEENKNLLEELSPLIRLNDRKIINIEKKFKKPKIADEQVLSTKVIMITPSKKSKDLTDNLNNKSPGTIAKKDPNNSSQVGIKISAEEYKQVVNQGKVTHNGCVNSSPDKPISKNLTMEDINKLPKLKLNLSDSNATQFNGLSSQAKTCSSVVLQLRALDPKLLNDSNLQEKLKRFRDQTKRESKTQDNSLDELFSDNVNDKSINSLSKNESFNNSRISYLTNENKFVEKTINPCKKQTLNNNNNNNNCNSSNSINNSNNNSVNKKTIEISENLVSTTTESTQSSDNKLNRLMNTADIFWNIMEKMKERSTHIELQSKKLTAGSLKDFTKQPTIEELKLRLSDQEKQIRQLQDTNKDLSEKLRKEKLAGNQLRINFMRCQKQVIELKNEVSAKTELINEIYEMSIKLKEYFEDGISCQEDEEEDDLSQT